MTKEELDVVDEASRESLPASDSPAWTVNGSPIDSLATAHQQKTTAGVLKDGLLAGVIGYVTMALYFTIASVATGHSPFFIPALLGSVLFFPATDVGLTVEAGPVLAYNGVHLLALLLAGTSLAWLAILATRTLQGWYLALIAVLFAVAHIVALPIWFREQLRGQLPLWLVVVGTALATVVMGAYLWIVNPGIRTAMHEPDD